LDIGAPAAMRGPAYGGNVARQTLRSVTLTPSMKQASTASTGLCRRILTLRGAALVSASTAPSHRCTVNWYPNPAPTPAWPTGG
jgi:hypothetical protein